jgi:2-polyprenyl-3-methyl-5-hydroxy-6-metoxy-1,4-benzoquinol methylase
MPKGFANQTDEVDLDRCTAKVSAWITIRQTCRPLMTPVAAIAAVLALWLDVISRSVPKGAVSEILDVGCGTGRYSTALAAHFNARVIAVDPSEKMLAEARKKATEGVRYERASAESLPVDRYGLHVDGLSSL